MANIESMKQGIIEYFKGIRAEWGKITWPQRNQIISETVIVVIVTTAFTILVFLLDIIFKFLLGLISR